MSLGYKGQLPQQQPPQYGAQSPPPMSPQVYAPQTNHTYSASPPPTEFGRTPSSQYYPPLPMQQVASGPQLAPCDHAQSQGPYLQHPQPVYGQHHHHPQQGGGQEFRSTVPIASLSSGGAPVQCPGCSQRGMTRTAMTVGNTTHAWAAGVCLFTGLGCIPYLFDSLKNVEHRCANCGVHLATWHRSGRTEVHMYA